MTEHSEPAKAIIDLITLFLFLIGSFLVIFTIAFMGNINVRDLAIGIELQIIGLGIFVLTRNRRSQLKIAKLCGRNLQKTSMLP